MARSDGSAAVAVFAMPQSAVRGALLRCISRLHHTVTLAAVAADGLEPETAALYVVETIDDLRADLRVLRAALRGVTS
jgi:hypothetical protein